MEDAIVANIHVYFLHPNFYVVGTRKNENGLWVEVEPACQIENNDLGLLVEALHNVNYQNIKNTDLNYWDGEKGRIWDNATFLCSILYQKKNVIIYPYLKIPVKHDQETGILIDGGWKSILKRRIKLPKKVSTSQLAEEIMLFHLVNKKGK